MFCVFLFLTPGESVPRNFSLNWLRKESLFTPTGTVANFWRTEVQKNNVQELSTWLISEGVYHPGVQEGELKKRYNSASYWIGSTRQIKHTNRQKFPAYSFLCKNLVFLLLEPPRSEVHWGGCWPLVKFWVQSLLFPSTSPLRGARLGLRFVLTDVS